MGIKEAQRKRAEAAGIKNMTRVFNKERKVFVLSGEFSSDLDPKALPVAVAKQENDIAEFEKQLRKALLELEPLKDAVEDREVKDFERMKKKAERFAKKRETGRKIESLQLQIKALKEDLEDTLELQKEYEKEMGDADAKEKP